MVVEKFQDTAAEPLDPLVLERIPESCQGRYAVSGYDLARGEQRTFFLEHMSDVREASADPREMPPLRGVIMRDCSMFLQFFEVADPRQHTCQAYNALKTGDVAVA